MAFRADIPQIPDVLKPESPLRGVLAKCQALPCQWYACYRRSPAASPAIDECGGLLFSVVSPLWTGLAALAMVLFAGHEAAQRQERVCFDAARSLAKSPTVIDGIRPRKSGSHQTPRWREQDSNHRSRVTRPIFQFRLWSVPRQPKSRGKENRHTKRRPLSPAEPMVRILLPPAESQAKSLARQRLRGGDDASRRPDYSFGGLSISRGPPLQAQAPAGLPH
jgi:hypothetical protein